MIIEYFKSLLGILAAVILTYICVLWSWDVSLHDVVRILTR